VGLDVGITRLPHSPTDGRFFGNPKPLERSLEKIQGLHKRLSKRKFLSRNWFKAKTRLAKEYEHLKDFGVTPSSNSVFYSHRVTTS